MFARTADIRGNAVHAAATATATDVSASPVACANYSVVEVIASFRRPCAWSVLTRVTRRVANAGNARQIKQHVSLRMLLLQLYYFVAGNYVHTVGGINLCHRVCSVLLCMGKQAT